MKCPRCGRTHEASGIPLCPDCRAELSQGSSSARPSQATSLNIDLAPILREALSSRRPGEDLDEALLRALKAHHPEHGLALLPPLTRVIETEAQAAGVDRAEAVARIAQRESGLPITFRTSHHTSPPQRDADGTTISLTGSTVINIDGKRYKSLDEVPPHLRGAVEQGLREAMDRERASGSRRVGCSIGLLVVFLYLVGILAHG